jgi:hypothetical protein
MKLLTFDQHTDKILSESIEMIDEAIDINGIKYSSKAELKKNLKAKLSKQTPLLANDEDFISQLAASYSNTDTE